MAILIVSLAIQRYLDFVFSWVQGQDYTVSVKLLGTNLIPFIFLFFPLALGRGSIVLFIFGGGRGREGSGSSVGDFPSGSRVSPRETEILVFQICDLDICSATCLFPSVPRAAFTFWGDSLFSSASL